MPYVIKNTADDRMKAHLHRLASKMVYEPHIGGMRLRLRESMELSDEQFTDLEPQLRQWESKGIIEIEKVGGEVEAAPVDTKMKTPAPSSEEPKMSSSDGGGDEEQSNQEPGAEASTESDASSGGEATEQTQTPTEGQPKRGRKSKFI